MSIIEQTLAEREARYGNFAKNAALAQAIKAAFAAGERWQTLSVDESEALEMIARKVARIVNGGAADYPDSWLDIAGYATLVANRLLEAAPVLDLESCLAACTNVRASPSMPAGSEA